MPFIELIAELIHRNFIMTVALSIIPLKLLMVRLCKDQSGEWITVLTMPEDLSYVSFGLILSSLTAAEGPLQIYFAEFRYPRTDIAIVLMMNFTLSVVLHKISQSWTIPKYQHWRSAIDVRGDNGSSSESQMELNLYPSDENVLRVLIHHFVGLLASLSFQFVLIGYWLYRIAAVFSSR